MATKRAMSGDQTPSDRRHVGLTVPGDLKQRAMHAAEMLEWSLGDWMLAAAAEHGPYLVDQLAGHQVPKRVRVPGAVFCALYLTGEEVAEIDDQAVGAGLNRSAFLTAVAQLALGEDAAGAIAGLIGEPPPEGEA